MGGQLKVLFSADNGAGATNSVNINRELWVWDHSTSSITSFEINGNPVGSSTPINFIEFNGNAYFFAQTSTPGPYQLFRYNGTTVVNLSQNVPNLVPATINSSVRMAVSNGVLYFVASVAGEGNELWSFDGSVAVRVRDINPGSTGSSPTELTDVNGTLFFAATNATNGRELWRSDGTSIGTVLAKDIIPFASSSNPVLLTKVQDYLYFFANNQFFPSRKDLWVADPRILTNVSDNNEQIRAFYRFNNNEGATLDESVPSEMVAVGNDFYFTATSLRPYNPGQGQGVGQETWYVRSCPEIAFNYNSDPIANNTICGGQGGASPIITFSPNTSNQICLSGNCFRSDNPNLVINANTGVIDLVATPPNTTAKVTYIYKEGECRVVKTVNVTVQQQTQVTTNVGTLAGSTAGFTNGISTAARFNFGTLSNPVGILDTDANISLAFSANGNFIYVADEVNHCIRRVNVTTQEVTTLSGVPGAFGGPGEGRFNRPTGVDVDAFGNIYVADKSNHLIRRIDPNTGISSVIAGDPTIPAPGGADVDSENPFQALFSSPSDIAVAADGTIYVADKNNHKIRKIAPNGVVSTLAGASSTASPKFGYVDGTGTAARFYFPSGIDLDSQGNIIVADMFNHRIRRITPAGVVTTIAGGGPSDTTPRDALGAALTARFYFPVDVTVSPTSDIFIADRSNHKIKRLSAGQVTLYAGTVAGSANGAATTVAEFRYPSGITLNGASLPYVVDRNNHRVRDIKVVNPTGDLVAPNSICGAGSATSLTITLVNYPDAPNPSRIVRWESSTDGGVTWINIGNPGSATYSPSTDLTQNTLFRAIVREAVCGELPSGTAFIQVSVPTPPIVTGDTKCADPMNNPITFTLVASGGASDSEYIWYNASMNNLNNANDTLIVNVNTTTQYFVAIRKGGNCESPPISITATIDPLPTPAIIASGGACAQNTQTYQTSITSGNTYTWTVTNGVILPENSNTVTALNRNQIQVAWNSNASGNIVLREENSIGCFRNVNLNVVINPLPTPVITSVNPNTTVCVDEQRVYNTPSVVGNSYIWTITPAASATVVSGQNTNEITLIWLANGQLTVTETINITTCFTTSAPTNITVSPRPSPLITSVNPNTTVCVDEQRVYNTPSVAGNSYDWMITPAASATVVSGQNTNEITLVWLANGQLTVTETVNATACFATSAPSNITVSPVPTPVITSVNPNTTVCTNEQRIYNTPSVVGHSYVWTITPASSATIVSGQNTNEITLIWLADGQLTVTETINATTCFATSAPFDATASPLPAPVITSVNPNATVCVNEQRVYNTPSVAGNSYTWTITPASSATVVSGQNTNEITLIWLAGGQLTVTETINATACFTTSAPTNIIVSPLPTPVITSVNPNTTVCVNEQRVYNTPNITGHSYTWTIIPAANATVVSGQNTNEITLIWLAGGQLTITETINATACFTTSAPTNITVSPLPTPVITSVNPNTTVCVDEQRVYNTPSVVGNSYVWTITPAASATVVSGQNANEITLIWLANGQLTVTETINATACFTTSAPFNTTTSPLPTPVISGESVVCLNDEEIYSVATVTGNTYSWTVLSGGTVTSATDANTATISWTSVGTHTIELIQTNTTTGCNATVTFDVEVGNIPNPVIVGSFDTCEGLTESYTITATTNTINWSVTNGSILSGQGTNSISVRFANNAVSAEVSVTETNPTTSCSTVATQTINLNAKPDPQIIGGVIACQGDVSTYSVVASGSDTYNWTVAGGTFTGQGTSQIDVTWGITEATGLISLTQTNAATCDSTITQNVTLIAQPDPTIIGTQVLCAGETATYTTSSAPAGQTYNYTWNITGLGTIISGQGTNQVEIQWDEMIADPTYLTVDITVAGTSCMASTPIPFDVGSFPVTLNPLPNPIITSTDNLACEGEVISYTTQDALEPTHTYNWTITGGTFVVGANPNEILVTWGAAGVGFVNLTQVTTETCEKIATPFEVDVQGSPELPLAADRYLCDTSLDLELTASEPSAQDFNWYTTETEPTPFQNGAAITLSGLTTDISYWVSAVNAAGCEGPRKEVNIDINPTTLPWTIQGFAVNADSCIAVAGDSPSGRIELSVGTENPPYTYQWSKDEDAGFLATTSAITELTRGTYRVTVTDAGGCTQDEVFTIDELLKEITDGLIETEAYIQNDTVIVGIGDRVELIASATDALTYNWLDEAGNEIGTEATLSFDDYRLDSQLLSVIITNDRNCSVVLSIYVKAVLLEVFVPKMFSPNGDNNNEYFRLYGNGIKSVNLKIFNRLGEMVFQTNEWVEGVPNSATEQVGWDGLFNGKSLPSDGYIWSVQGLFVNNKEIKFNGKQTGDLLLVR
jgi:gliding motility-associated-like protein